MNPMRKKHLPYVCILLFFLFMLTSCEKGQSPNASGENVSLDVDVSRDAFFLSMFPIDGFSEEDFATYEGIPLSMSSTTFQDYEALYAYALELKSKKSKPSKLYLGLDPGIITPDQAKDLISLFPNTDFKIFPEYRPLSAWLALKDAASLVNKYEELSQSLSELPRVKVYPFFAQEWIIADPNNYLEGSTLKEDVSQRVFLYTLFNEEDRDPRIRPGEAKELCDGLRDLISRAASGAYDFPDLSGWKLVFLGDSVFGNFTDRRSITGYLHDLAGATTYNCGWGGITASENEGRSFVSVLDALLKSNPAKLPENVQARIGLTELFASESLESLNSSDVIFLLHYGINDYLQGVPVETQNPLDAGSYCGAVRSGIEQLKAAFPKAHVLIIIPNHVLLNQKGTENVGENGSPYEAYVDALTGIAKEYGIPYLDDYHGIVEFQKSYVHLDDRIHPNDYGRFQISHALMQLIQDEFSR